MPRYAKLTIVCGRRGSGKSNKTITQIFKAVANGQKALIFDAMDEYKSYRYRENQMVDIKPIFYKDIPRFTAQIPAELVRVRPMHDKDGSPLSTQEKQEHLSYVLKNYRNGILLTEDTNVYIADNAPNDIMGSLATLRQAGVDLIMHFQLIQKAANPKILGMANYIRLHKTTDQVARFRDRFLDKTDIMMIAEKIVNRRFAWGIANGVKDETGQYFSCLVDFDDHKIRGIFNQDEAKYAIRDYMNSNGGSAVKELLSQRDHTGKKIWKDYGAAYSYLENKLMKEFFLF